MAGSWDVVAEAKQRERDCSLLPTFRQIRWLTRSSTTTRGWYESNRTSLYGTLVRACDRTLLSSLC